MADSTNDIVIRSFDAQKDLKEVQMLIGMSSMEQLAVANRLAYFHPVSVSIWLVCAGTFIQLLHAWPVSSGPGGWLGYLAPLPILACTALPILFGIDWLHRPIFENMLKANIQNFTKAIAIRSTGNPSAKPLHFVVEYKKTPIGYAFLQPVTPANQKHVYRVAHFHVDAPYRRAGVGSDLLSFIIKHLGNTKCEISGVTTLLTPYTTECLQTAGFVRNEQAVEIWEQGKIQEEARGGNQNGTKMDSSNQSVLLVDTRRTGWLLKVA